MLRKIQGSSRWTRANSSPRISRYPAIGVKVASELPLIRLNKRVNASDSMERKDVEIMLESLELKTDLKFERLISESNLKFANLIHKVDESIVESHLKYSQGQTLIAEAESKHAKWVIGLAFAMIAFVIASVGFSTILILKAVDRQQNSQVAAQPPIIVNISPSPTPIEKAKRK